MDILSGRLPTVRLQQFQQCDRSLVSEGISIRRHASLSHWPPDLSLPSQGPFFPVEMFRACELSKGN